MGGSPPFLMSCKCGFEVQFTDYFLCLWELLRNHPHVPETLDITCACGARLKTGPRLGTIEQINRWLETHKGHKAV